IPDTSSCGGAGPFRQCRSDVVPGRTQEHGRLVVCRALSRMGAQPCTWSTQARALHRSRRVCVDGDRSDVAAPDSIAVDHGERLCGGLGRRKIMQSFATAPRTDSAIDTGKSDISRVLWIMAITAGAGISNVFYVQSMVDLIGGSLAMRPATLGLVPASTIGG